MSAPVLGRAEFSRTSPSLKGVGISLQAIAKVLRLKNRLPENLVGSEFAGIHVGGWGETIWIREGKIRHVAQKHTLEQRQLIDEYTRSMDVMWRDNICESETEPPRKISPMRRHRKTRSTPQGEHRPVLLDEVLQALEPRPGMTVVDCTIGWAGHGVEILSRIGPAGLLIGLDLDADNLPRARERLSLVGYPFHLHHSNFAGLQQALATHDVLQVDGILADLGMSSMQVDDPARGFSYVRDGALDMRMDRTRGRTAAELLATIEEEELARQLAALGDEPHAEVIARAIVAARIKQKIATTRQLAEIIQEATRQKDWRLHPARGKWNLHPAARTFQALRILVNRELANLEHLLRLAPQILKPGGVVAIISFHSGEDRLVKAAFRTGLECAQYQAIALDPVRASMEERGQNPRSRSAKLRWARR